MEFFADVAILSRFQFALTVFFHFLFVPLSIGLGLFLAIFETRYYRSRKPEDMAISQFWAKIFTTTFVIGVATGITMEFSFGTNWANYSRFVGDIFGAPLAAEALLAFFLESVFLGVVLFARNKVKPGFYLASTWLVWAGSALSALWILIANSWMQTPAGFELAADGSKAIITDFWAAALNPSTVPRYVHTVDALLILGSFCVMAVGAYYLLRQRTPKQIEYGKSFLKTGLVVGIITVILMLPAGHLQAAEVAAEQPAKLAAMEGQWEDGPVALSLFGWVDSDGKSTAALELPIRGFTSFLASGNFDTVYPGLNTLTQGPVDLQKYPAVAIEQYGGGVPPVNIVFQSYHIMIALWALMLVWLVIGLVLLRSKRLLEHRVLIRLLVFGPLIPFVSIQAGWMVAEIGRQPWVVYDLLLTNDAISMSVSPVEVLITIVCFLLIYTVLFIAWLRIILRRIKNGPDLDKAVAQLNGNPSAQGKAKVEVIVTEAVAQTAAGTVAVGTIAVDTVQSSAVSTDPKGGEDK